jgi:hypothetical protein
MRPYLPISWAAAVALAAGCGQAGDKWPRQPVSGTVMLDGRPLDQGQITFVPTGGDGPAVGGMIQDGAYAIQRADGPVPGSHRVAVYSAKPTGRKIKDETDPNVLYDEQAETIPDRYNAHSELKAEVKSGGGNTFIFELTGGKGVTKTKR